MDMESVKKTLDTISRLSREGISEVRGFMQSLDTKELTWRTLAAELRSQGTNMVEPHHIGFSLEAAVEDVEEQLSSLLWVNVFKIYKEALTNVIKHASARSVSVALLVERNRVLLSVQDDGDGWEKTTGSGRGLANMRKRAEDIGGRLTLSTGNGTRMSLEVPIPLKYPISGMAM
jgi:signal transduction histidine kinase